MPHTHRVAAKKKTFVIWSFLQQLSNRYNDTLFLKRIFLRFFFAILTLHIQQQWCILAYLQRRMLHNAQYAGIVMGTIDRRQAGLTFRAAIDLVCVFILKRAQKENGKWKKMHQVRSAKINKVCVVEKQRKAAHTYTQTVILFPYMYRLCGCICKECFWCWLKIFKNISYAVKNLHATRWRWSLSARHTHSTKNL